MKPLDKKKRSNIISIILLFAYLGFISYFGFLSKLAGRKQLHEGRYNLVPFYSIHQYFTASGSSGAISFIINILGNLIVFMPVGIFVSYFSKNTVGAKRLFLVTMIGLAFSFCVESIQFIFSVGVFDVDDLILNTIGAVLGFLIYMTYQSMHTK